MFKCLECDSIIPYNYKTSSYIQASITCFECLTRLVLYKDKDKTSEAIQIKFAIIKPFKRTYFPKSSVLKGLHKRIPASLNEVLQTTIGVVVCMLCHKHMDQSNSTLVNLLKSWFLELSPTLTHIEQVNGSFLPVEVERKIHIPYRKGRVCSSCMIDVHALCMQRDNYGHAKAVILPEPINTTRDGPRNVNESGDRKASRKPDPLTYIPEPKTHTHGLEKRILVARHVPAPGTPKDQPMTTRVMTWGKPDPDPIPNRKAPKSTMKVIGDYIEFEQLPPHSPHVITPMRIRPRKRNTSRRYS